MAVLYVACRLFNIYMSYSICILSISSIPHPFFLPYSIQYFVEAFIKAFLEIGIVTLKVLYFPDRIDLAKAFILIFASILNGVDNIASPLPIFKTDPKV